MIDAAKLKEVRTRADKFHIGNAGQQIADLRFLISAIDELEASRQKVKLLVKQIGESTDEEAADYRRCTFTSRRVCTRTAYNAAKEATA